MLARTLSICLIILWTSLLVAQNMVKGSVSDADSGDPIIGANVIIDGTSDGTVTDVDGSFSIATDRSFPLMITISYTGFASQKIEVSDGSQMNNVALAVGSIFDEVIVTASRKPEKVQNAPASVTVLNARAIESANVANPISLLQNTVGVSIEKQGTQRTNISMRGASDLFSTSAFVMMDYRSLIGAGLNTFDAGATALNTLDMDRVEVVRGPGSALYGPGVTAGVVHFLTKNPFKYPGTSVEFSAGNLNTFKAAIRHAGHNANNTFGYKITAFGLQADEWKLDPNNETDAETISKFKQDIFDPKDGALVGSTGGQLNETGVAYGGSASLYFRPTPGLNLVTTGGFNYSEGLYWSQQGEGYQAATDVYLQTRATYKGWFAQLYYNTNTVPSDLSKTGFLYRTGTLSALDRAQLEAQLQYNFTLDKIKTDFTIGGDYRAASFDSQTRTFGRNEDNDDYDISGAYIQSKTALTSKLDMVLAARYDQFSAIDEGSLSPRAALVYKPADNHTFRASYNQAYAPNSALDVFGDLQIDNIGSFDIWLKGNNTAQTFDNLQTTWLIPGVGPSPGLGMDMGTAFGLANFVLNQEIANGNPELSPLAFILPIVNDPALLVAMATSGGYSNGYPVDVEGNFLPLEGTPAASLRQDNTYEIGYAGSPTSKLALQVDVYRVDKKNFTGLRQISPLVVLPTLGSDLESQFITTFTEHLVGLGYAQETAANLANIVAPAYGSIANAVAAPTGTPTVLGLVETDQMPEGGLPHLAYGYRNFGELTYYGVDAGANYLVSDAISIFGNYSWVSDNSFVGAELGEDEASTNRFDLNFSQHRIRAGAAYQPLTGVQGGFSVMHNSEFEANLGIYGGTVAARTLVDFNVGYKMSNGLALTVSVENALNNKYRTFPTMPEIGTRVLGTIRYVFGNK